MKNFLYLTLTLVQATISFAQDSQGVSLSHYVFPEFTEGVVKNKSGAIDKARLNYNAITQEFIFEKGTQKLALAQISTIDT
ncbi:MAG: hypothetical protein JWQ25_1422, partial [Daejeonella sp.]|nr:hypothetical protein [Daejeonella sp.]